METKKCCKCKEWLCKNEFKSNSSRKDGLQGQCITCQKKYRRKHYLANRAKYIKKSTLRRIEFGNWWKEYKKQFSCILCKENESCCIDFHHKDDDKEGNVSALINSGNKTRVLKEVAKCVPLCSNCHRKLHAGITQLAECQFSKLDVVGSYPTACTK